MYVISYGLLFLPAIDLCVRQINRLRNTNTQIFHAEMVNLIQLAKIVLVNLEQIKKV